MVVAGPWMWRIEAAPQVSARAWRVMWLRAIARAAKGAALAMTPIEKARAASGTRPSSVRAGRYTTLTDLVRRFEAPIF